MRLAAKLGSVASRPFDGDNPMAKRIPPANPVFSAAEATILGLYDGGVLSPAVLQRVIAGFAGSGIRWNSECVLRSVDDKSLHEVVALTMMPGRAIRNAEKDFNAVIEHLHGAQDAAASSRPDEAPDEASDELMEQLGGSASRKTASKTAGKTSAKSSRKTARDTVAKKSQSPAPGFNPLFRATAPGRASE